MEIKYDIYRNFNNWVLHNVCRISFIDSKNFIFEYYIINFKINVINNKIILVLHYTSHTDLILLYNYDMIYVTITYIFF